MCTALLKLSLLFVSVTWCSALDEHSEPPALDHTGVHVRITAEAIEITIRVPRVRGASQPGLPGAAARRAGQFQGLGSTST